MSILDLIKDKTQWNIFYKYKDEKGHLTKQEKEELKSFIDDEKYLDIANNIKDTSYNFSVPVKKEINKSGTDKKRTVYCYSKEENIVLKFITFNLSKYDYKLMPNCYSFRKDFGVRKALDTIISSKNIDDMYAYKVDIKNYFNSIDIDRLLVILKDVIEDEELYSFFVKLLTLDKAYFNDKLIEEKRGAMAGVPFSPFLANIYLTDLDKYFYDNNILYARYSDDIIVFASSLEELEKYKEYIVNTIHSKGLKINPNKEYTFNPNEGWNFLGIQYSNGLIDLSDVTMDKIKGKIRRKARALYRWKIRKNASDERAIRAMIKTINHKFFDATMVNDLTWSRWFFPLITTDTRLKEVDSYLQYYLRYISTGKHNKSNYNIRYSKLKEYKYRSLVNEYYKTKSNG